MKIAIFVADEGYGHAMRQKNIIHELLDHLPFLKITVFGKDKLDILKDEFEDRIAYVDIFNLLLTAKDEKGNLDVENTKDLFYEWYKNRNDWINKTLSYIDPETELIISDSVPQISKYQKSSILSNLTFNTLHGIGFIQNYMDKMISIKD